MELARNGIRLSWLVIFVVPVALRAQSHVPVGVARIDVTPEHPVVLAGYGGRSGEHEGVDTRLWARALVIGDQQPVAIVVLDNCGVPAPIVARVAEGLKRHGVERDRLVVAATHTHNAPNLEGYAAVLWAGRTTPEQDQHVRDYTQFAVEKMQRAVVAALEAREPMTLEWAQGRVTFGGNRRVLNRGRWAGFGFQRSGPVDHSMPVLAARDEAGTVRAVWANYACHCTTAGSQNRIGGDWAGFANEAIEKKFPSAVSLMSIGCGADVGPQPSGNLSIAEQHGQSIGREVARLLNGETTELDHAPAVATRTIRLPLDVSQSREYWDGQLRTGGFHQQLAKAILRKLEDSGRVPDHVDYPLTVWSFGDDLAIVFLAGEVVVDYSVRLNRELDWQRLWITAWANDMPGYIPSRRLLREGGYETDFSQVYYAQPGRYAPEIEDLLVEAVCELVGKQFAAKPDQKPAPFHRVPSNEPAVLRRLAEWARSDKPQEEARILDRVRELIPLARPAVDSSSIQGGEDSEWYNYAGDFSLRRFIRQQKRGAELQWRSAETAGDRSKSVTLCFSGGIGWESQPPTDGFLLSVAGQTELRFDLTRKPTRWMSDGGEWELVFLPTWTSDVDSAGFFFLTAIEPVGNQQGRFAISVRSLGEGSLRWFAVDVNQAWPTRLKRLSEALRTTAETR